jgi:hypothetical protein
MKQCVEYSLARFRDASVSISTVHSIVAVLSCRWSSVGYYKVSPQTHRVRGKSQEVVQTANPLGDLYRYIQYAAYIE